MTRVRICIVGGGSYNWTPTILQDLALTPGLSGTIVLHDINPDAAATMRATFFFTMTVPKAVGLTGTFVAPEGIR